MISLIVNPEAGGTTLFGKKVSTLQTGISVDSGKITGTLKYVTGYTGFSGDPEEQNGNYLALKMTATEGATTRVKIVGGSGNWVTLDEDMNIVLLIRNNTQQVVVECSKEGYVTKTRTYDLTDLILQSQA